MDTQQGLPTCSQVGLDHFHHGSLHRAFDCRFDFLRDAADSQGVEWLGQVRSWMPCGRHSNRHWLLHMGLLVRTLQVLISNLKEETREKGRIQRQARFSKKSSKAGSEN